MNRLSPYFFKSLPDFFKIQDSYKDINGEGFLERYLNVFEWEAESYLNDIGPDNELREFGPLSDIIFPDRTPESHLSLLGYFYGSPPDVIWDETFYRRLLKFIFLINRYKGTIRGVRKFFKLLGIEIVIIIKEIVIPYYDENPPLLYDDTTLGPYIYDIASIICRDYDAEIVSINPNSNFDKNNPKHIKNIEFILDYLLPIYLHRENLILP